MRIVLGLLLIGGMFQASVGQTEDYPLESNVKKGWEVIRTRVFEGTGLWGYIDGGADIYLEYGFERVYVQDVSLDKLLYKIETYCMRDEAAAFGIFSVNRFQCDIDDSIRIIHCLTPYQILAVAGTYYLIISNQSGTSEAAQGGVRLLMTMQGSIRNGSYPIPEPFNKLHAEGQLICMRGKLGLMNGYPILTDLFEPYSNFTLFILPLTDEDPKSILARIDFTDRQDQAELFQQLEQMRDSDVGDNDLLIRMQRIDPSGLIFFMGSKDNAPSLQPFLEFFAGE